MNIAIIGSGGREHAICQKIYESPLSKKIYCMPGNAGTAKIAVNLSINLNNFKKVLQVIKFYKIKLVIIGPEEPLVNGLSDFLSFHLKSLSSRLGTLLRSQHRLCNHPL